MTDIEINIAVAKALGRKIGTVNVDGQDVPYRVKVPNDDPNSDEGWLFLDSGPIYDPVNDANQAISEAVAFYGDVGFELSYCNSHKMGSPFMLTPRNEALPVATGATMQEAICKAIMWSHGDEKEYSK